MDKPDSNKAGETRKYKTRMSTVWFACALSYGPERNFGLASIELSDFIN